MWPFDRKKKRFEALRNILCAFANNFNERNSQIGKITVRQSDGFRMLPTTQYAGSDTALIVFEPFYHSSDSDSFYDRDDNCSCSTHFAFLEPIKVMVGDHGKYMCRIRHKPLGKNNIF